MKASFQHVAKCHFRGKNRKGEIVALVKGIDGLWYAFKDGVLPAVSSFKGDTPLIEVLNFLA